MASSNEREKGYKFCLDHLKEELTLMCLTCKVPLCIECITSKLHKGHDYESIKKHVQVKYTELQRFKTKASTQLIPDINQKAKAADEDFEIVSDIIQTRIQNARDQGSYLKALIDDQVSSTEIEYNSILTSFRIDHNNYKSESGNALKTINTLLEESTAATKSDNNLLLIDVVNDVASRNFNIKKYAKPEVPTFITGSDPQKHIQAVFGSVDKVKEFQHAQAIQGAIPKAIGKDGESHQVSDCNLTPTHQSEYENKGKTHKQRPDKPTHTNPPSRMLMNKAEQTELIPLHVLDTPQSMVRTKDGNLIIYYGGTLPLSIVYSKSILTSLGVKTSSARGACDVDISDIAIDISTDQLYCVSYERQDVRSLNIKTKTRSVHLKGKTTKLFDIGN